MSKSLDGHNIPLIEAWCNYQGTQRIALCSMLVSEVQMIHLSSIQGGGVLPASHPEVNAMLKKSTYKAG